jgi:hypothetical protein
MHGDVEITALSNNPQKFELNIGGAARRILPPTTYYSERAAPNSREQEEYADGRQHSRRGPVEGHHSWKSRRHVVIVTFRSMWLFLTICLYKVNSGWYLLWVSRSLLASVAEVFAVNLG